MKAEFDTNMLLQLIEVLERRQDDDADAERADAIRTLRHLRNQIAHGRIVPAEPGVGTAIMAAYLQLVEQTSLGTRQARRVRARSEPADIAEVLRRSDASKEKPRRQ